MKIQIISNDDYPIGNIIRQELQDADSTQIAVAFLTRSGVKEIDVSLRTSLDNGGKIELIAGLDFRRTDPDSIRYFLALKKQYPKRCDFYCFGDKEDNKAEIVFHPKIYLFEKPRETTCIVGSTNLTKGGLTSNLEVNTIFKETKPDYFSKLQAIYNSIKFKDSVFAPDEEYAERYSAVRSAISKKEPPLSKDEKLQEAMTEIRNRAEDLPGTVPSIKLLIINAVKKIQGNSGKEFAPLSAIYEEVERVVKGDEYLLKKYKMNTLRHTIRGDLNRHENESKDSNSMRLFTRSREGKGNYALTEKGKNYQGR